MTTSVYNLVIRTPRRQLRSISCFVHVPKPSGLRHHGRTHSHNEPSKSHTSTGSSLKTTSVHSPLLTTRPSSPPSSSATGTTAAEQYLNTMDSDSDMFAMPLIATLLARTPPPPLTARTVWRPELTPQIDQLNAGLNVRAVLHLLNDDFDACHSLAQTQEGNPYSDHLHCIAHRREPDYWNSKWWVARLSHPHLGEIYVPDTSTASISQVRKAMGQFVDAVQAAESSGSGVTELEQRQWAELTKLTRILIEIDGEKKKY